MKEINDDHIKQEAIEDLTGNNDDADAISLSGIKPGELGSKEKPARTLNEFQNLMEDKLSDENIDINVKNAPLPVTDLSKNLEVLKIGIGLLHPKKHMLYRYILTRRLAGVGIKEIAIKLNNSIENVIAAENAAVSTVCELIAKNQNMLNKGIVIG